MKFRISLFCLIFFSAGCTLYYAKPYLIGTQTMELTGSDYTKEGSIAYARSSADYECKREGRARAVILQEKTTYTGALGKTETSRAIRASSAPSDYQTQIKFRCAR